MIILKDLLSTINSAERVSIDLRDEDTKVLINGWYDTPSSLLMIEDVKRLHYAFVNEIEVDDEGEIVITILVDMEG